MPPLHYPKSMGTCVIVRSAPQQTTGEGEWYWREAVIHETGYLSPSWESLPHAFNTANHQINVHRHSPPPCKTNYLSILYCQVPSTLCLCRLQLVKESIKYWGRYRWRRNNGRRWEVESEESCHCTSRQEAWRQGWMCYRADCTLRIFHDAKLQHGLFLWVSHKSSPSEVPKYSVL